MPQDTIPPTDDSDLMDAHRRVVEQFKKDTNSAVEAFQKSAPTEREGLVYHYTGDVGLYQILASGGLWMTDFTKLNDPKEIEYGLDVGRASLAAACGGPGQPGLRLFQSIFDSVAALGIHKFMRAFILSMSTAPDELSQWRAYADNANGYRLAFNSAVLDVAFDPAKIGGAGGSFLVQYDPARLTTEMNTLVQQATAAVNSLPCGPSQRVKQAMSRISTHLMLSMVLIALHFKHPAYEAEMEFRYLISTAAGGPIPGMRQRARRHGLIDYLAFDWKSRYPQALVEIMSGPAVEFPRAQAFAQETLLLHFPRMHTVLMNPSVIPYRL